MSTESQGKLRHAELLLSRTRLGAGTHPNVGSKPQGGVALGPHRRQLQHLCAMDGRHHGQSRRPEVGSEHCRGNERGPARLARGNSGRRRHPVQHTSREDLPCRWVGPKGAKAASHCALRPVRGQGCSSHEMARARRVVTGCIIHILKGQRLLAGMTSLQGLPQAPHSLAAVPAGLQAPRMSRGQPSSQHQYCMHKASAMGPRKGTSCEAILRSALSH